MFDAFPSTAETAVVAAVPCPDVAPASLAGPAASRLKRACDVVAAAALLVLFAPLLLLVAAAIRLESKGPALFRQRRTGLNGQVFQIYKLRTMTVAEDGAAVRQATAGDARVTRIGALLRKSSVDELPQLLNVLKGDMSMIGPRPHALAHDEFYGALLPAYAARFRARPGLTGQAQVTGHRGETRTINCMAKRVNADNAYIEGWSLLRDARIVAQTLLLLWRDPQAY
ncbi:sugar transferase [Caulobacter sp. 17J80-11]|uniref:sugar transferase n=1 Tax=Caulobacter sp. 17J80-11 TaxID=2763502 RepID=UPI001653A915|nr:sugar transferase [Caulobacter sp. 17J80-11]MBC6982481.1 sugar transferase [Caulobacter sp. 17J80-11]